MESKNIRKLIIVLYATNMQIVESKMLFFQKLSVYNALR